MDETRRDLHGERREASPPPNPDPAPETWPAGIRKLAVEELSALGIDVNQQLYWHGKPIALGQMLVLTSSQKVWGTILATGALLAFLATIAQGWVAAATWMCEVGMMHTWCPAS
jgi:hypothetical protein